MHLGDFAERMEATAAGACHAGAAAPSAGTSRTGAGSRLDAQHGFDFGDADDSFDVSNSTTAAESHRTPRTGSPTGCDSPDALAEHTRQSAPTGFRAPAQKVSTAEVLKFLIDRTKYIQLLEAEDTPDALARIENLHELVNAAMDSRDRGESISDFLDHAALVSDVDQFDETRSRSP